MDIGEILKNLEINLGKNSGADLSSFSPIDGRVIATLSTDKKKDVDGKISEAVEAHKAWRDIPAPRRGELIRLFGEELREHKESLSKLVTVECGKIIEEGRGEVQEMIDICDFAVGLSRQLYGLTIASEREDHTMQENWLPLGVVGVISAFNFPVAVWAWNFTLAIVCGNSVIWKPSEKTPTCAVVCQELFKRASKKFGDSAPKGLSQILLGDSEIGETLVTDNRIALLSATGSCKMGKTVAPKVAKRFGRSLLELGGNNAVIVTKNADVNLALQSIVFGAVATAGQRCTTIRRALIHREIYQDLFTSLQSAYQQIVEKKIGNPLSNETLVGPLIDEDAYNRMQKAIEAVKKQGGEVFFGNRTMQVEYRDAFYVEPALIRMQKHAGIVCDETFAPILYVIPYENLDEAIEMNNSVAQGLSSAIFTTDLREAEYFKRRSDCGIVNVNIGTSGAEIGGAFGGEKETGGGREAGSDSWKAYMRRQTSTTYYGNEKPALAQGIKFDT